MPYKLKVLEPQKQQDQVHTDEPLQAIDTVGYSN